MKIVIQDTFKYSIVSREYHVLDVSNFSDIFCFNYKKFDKRMKKAMREHPNDIVIKPYLFPLSSMTEEHQKEEYEICKEFIIGYESNLIDFYNRYHYDYRGLIPMGIAIDATGKNIY